MPTPFMCHECDKPTMNDGGICDNCEEAYVTGNSEHLRTVINLENRIEWLEEGLKLISTAGDQHNPIHLKEQALATLDGEPTTADEYNAKSKLELEKVNKGLEVLKKSESDADEVNKDECPIPGSRDYWEPKDENVVYISDVNKEIAKEWKNEDG